METRSKKRIRLMSEEALKSEYDYLNNFPDELLVEIFRYLTTEQKSIAGRVCRKFYRISRHPELWKKVDVAIDRQPSRTVTALLEMLPKTVSYLRLRFGRGGNWKLKAEDLSAKLHRCPNLKVLILDNARLKSRYYPDYWSNNLLTINTKERVLHFSHIVVTYRKFLCFFDMEVLILDLNPCSNVTLEMVTDTSIFVQLSGLRELRLHNMTVDQRLDIIFPVISYLDILDLGNMRKISGLFQLIQDYGSYLTELYLCQTCLEDKDFRCEDSRVFPLLTTLCLCGCLVTYKIINSLIKYWRSLQTVYVDDKCSGEYDYSKCRSPKVKIVRPYSSCKHWDVEKYFPK